MCCVSLSGSLLSGTKTQVSVEGRSEERDCGSSLTQNSFLCSIHCLHRQKGQKKEVGAALP